MCFSIELYFINCRLIAFIFYVVAQADHSYAVGKVGSMTFVTIGLWSANLAENCKGNTACNKIKATRAFFVISTIVACKWNRMSAIAGLYYFLVYNI